jgi:VanZ family protein
MAARTDAKEKPAGRLALWGPVVLWAAVIFTFSSIPNLATDLGTWDLLLRKLAHFAEFGVLGALLVRALRNEPAAFALGSLYAATDELHQSFVAGRVGSPLDWTLDTAGVLLGVLLLSRSR